MVVKFVNRSCRESTQCEGNCSPPWLTNTRHSLKLVVYIRKEMYSVQWIIPVHAGHLKIFYTPFSLLYHTVYLSNLSHSRLLLPDHFQLIGIIITLQSAGTSLLTQCHWFRLMRGDASKTAHLFDLSSDSKSSCKCCWKIKIKVFAHIFQSLRWLPMLFLGSWYNPL